MQVKAPRDGYVTVFPCRGGTYTVKCFYREPVHLHAGGPMNVEGDALVCDILNMTAQQIKELCGREPRWTLKPKTKKKNDQSRG